jgi:hypothetical protein
MATTRSNFMGLTFSDEVQSQDYFKISNKIFTLQLHKEKDEETVQKKALHANICAALRKCLSNLGCSTYKQRIWNNIFATTGHLSEYENVYLSAAAPLNI